MRLITRVYGIFRATIFLYSACCNLEGTKDTLCYKIQKAHNWSELQCCAQTRVAIKMHSWTAWSAARFERPAQHAGHVPPSLERSKMRCVLYHSVVVDLTFEQSENVVVSSSSCYWPALRDVVYKVIGSKFSLLHVHCTNGWHTAREMMLLRFSLSMWA